jgi:CheY-like chemotaxis protein
MDTPRSRTFRRPTTVLVVDDHPLMLATIRTTLEREGYRVLVASNGAAALDVCRADVVDLVVLDHEMPGMNGLQVAERLRSNPLTFAIPILFTTSSTDSLSVRFVDGRWTVATISKPFRAAQLRESVARLVSVRYEGSLAFA